MIAVALAALTLAAAPTEGVPLGAHGKAVVGQRGAGTYATFTVEGLKPGATVHAILQSGTCKRPSASVASVGSARIGADGRAAWGAFARFRREHVAWSTVSDGGHVIVLLVGGRGRVGCGAIPGMS